MQHVDLGRHLYQPVKYQAANGSWYKDYAQAIAASNMILHWDTAALLSYLSFDYICGDRTLIREIRRQPWMSTIDSEGKVKLWDIPPHGNRWLSSREIALCFEQRLSEEIFSVCQGREHIYILLSGGLDSRIVAGIVAKLIREGRLNAKPIAATWGRETSRDVVYGQKVAEVLGFEWIRIDLRPENVLENINIVATEYGCQFSPVHLHAMTWFHSVSPETLVLAGSYGDSVGRAEFSGKHILELDYLRPRDQFHLMKVELLEHAHNELLGDLRALHCRAQGQPKHVLCEHEMQAHYMRGLISAAMNVIGDHCQLYQAFSAPSVYSYMWSIHPALRSDKIYAELLESLDKRLARLPWARTNRALQGKTAAAQQQGLDEKFHSYERWISGPLYNDLSDYIEPTWFAELGLFSERSISLLLESAIKNPQDSQTQKMLVWLASFRCFAEWLEKRGIDIILDPRGRGSNKLAPSFIHRSGPMANARKKVQQVAILHLSWKKARRSLLRLRAIRKFQPIREKVKDT